MTSGKILILNTFNHLNNEEKIKSGLFINSCGWKMMLKKDNDAVVHEKLIQIFNCDSMINIPESNIGKVKEMLTT